VLAVSLSPPHCAVRLVLLEDRPCFCLLLPRCWPSASRVSRADPTGADGSCEGYLLSLNKAGGPRVPSCAKMRICRMPVSIDLAGVSCYKRLRRRTPLGASCLEFAGSDGIRSGAPMFLSNRFILKGALQNSTSCYHHES
jgi:hypothetical protein